MSHLTVDSVDPQGDRWDLPLLAWKVGGAGCVTPGQRCSRGKGARWGPRLRWGVWWCFLMGGWWTVPWRVIDNWGHILLELWYYGFSPMLGFSLSLGFQAINFQGFIFIYICIHVPFDLKHPTGNGAWISVGFWWFLVLSVINHSILGVSNFDTSHTHVIYIYACFLLHEYIEIIGACKWDFNTILFYNDSIIAYYI